MCRAVGVALAVVAAVAFATALATGAGAATGPLAPYDGHNPFACTLQQLGTGTNFPQPNADPFCVEYDKRHQNVTQLGVVQFLSQEPARVAAASPKCFYFQRDHWVGSIVQGQPSTQTYAWDGSYFFDKARGLGGVYVEHFSFNGRSADPRALPGFPAEWRPYFGNGRGGVQETGNVTVDPRCADRANPSGPGGGDGPYPKPGGRCRAAGGQVDGRGIGGAELGAKRSAAKRDLGRPTTESSGYLTWCFDGGGRLVAGLKSAGASARIELVLTDAPPFDARGLRPGGSAKPIGKLKQRRRLGRVHGMSLVTTPLDKRTLLVVGARDERVAYLAVARKKLSDSRLKAYLRHLPA